MKYISLILLFLCQVVNSTTYYVTPSGGNDNNSGTIDQPWATWQKAFNTAEAGDTVYFRGGTWYPTQSIKYNIAANQGNNGTHANPICFFNYPGETPIINAINFPVSSIGTSVIDILDSSTYLNFRGIIIENLIQHKYVQDGDTLGQNNTVFSAHEIGNMSIDRMIIRNSGAAGFWLNGYDTLYIRNCDVYNLCDSFKAIVTGHAGGKADGFNISGRSDSPSDTNKVVYITGSRVWNCSDDCFDLNTMSEFHVDSCWMWGGPILDGDGTGIKLAGSLVRTSSKRVIRNCIFANKTTSTDNGGGGIGITNLDYIDFGPVGEYYNNFMYDCWYGLSQASGDFDCTIGYTKEIVKNNIVYIVRNTPFGLQAKFPNSNCGTNPPSFLIESNNTFRLMGIYGNTEVNPEFSVTNIDFISLDTSELALPRSIDGSLPYVNFGRLRATSDLIDAGVYVGLPYNGAAPDLGPFECSPIIANHTVVDKYDDIPQYYIDQVKKMFFVIAGESHSMGYVRGLVALESLDPVYDVSYTYQGTPEAYTPDHLRASRVTWGDLTNVSGWIYGYGEEDWFTSETAINRTKAGISYCYNNDLEMSAFGFGWCYDGDDISIPDYISATKSYIDYCNTNNINTKVYFTTGPVDGLHASGELGYIKHQMYERIRDSVRADPSRILFDFADILCYDDSSDTPNTATWNGNTYPVITTANNFPDGPAHISEIGELRLAKAVWWMLARIAGWDGLSSDTVPDQPSTSTDILTFTLSSQVSSATINSTAHTVAITVAYGTNITSLTPAITVSTGATISPTSGTARNFTSPQTYTVTAEDGTTTQAWTVTVTVAEAPAEPEEPTTTGTKRVRLKAGSKTVHQGIQKRVRI